jgi:hypothetical protein
LAVVQKNQMTILDQYDRAFRHFDMIAKQRIASFNHYLVVLGVLLTATAAVKLGPMHKLVLASLGAANMIAPVLFWCLDERINRLLANLKDTLFHIEEAEDWPDSFKPFHRDKREQRGLFHKATTYTGVFWSLFLIHFVLGFVLTIYAIGCPKANAPTSDVQAPAVGTRSVSPQGATTVLRPAQPSGKDPSGTLAHPPQK